MSQDPENTRPMTHGERAVGLSFNPSGDTNVAEMKRKFAELIDDINNFREGADPDVARMCSVAITELQTAQMWFTKAQTWNK